MSHSAEEVAREVAEELLDKIPEDAKYWCGRHIYSETCNKRNICSQRYRSAFCTRLPGHIGDHVALSITDSFICRWPQRKETSE